MLRRIGLPLLLACLLFVVMAIIDHSRLGTVHWGVDAVSALVLFVVNITMTGSEGKK